MRPLIVRCILLTSIALSLLMVATAVSSDRPLLAMPGALTIILEPTIALAIYAVLILWITNGHGPRWQLCLRFGTTAGWIVAAVQVAHVASENFMHFRAPWDSVVTIAFMLGSFVIWGIAGFLAARSAGAVGPGVLAGSWSAVVTMSVAVTAGLALELCWIMPKPEDVATWTEFMRSGWTDVHAFTIANTLDSAFSHLVAGPIVGAIFGGVGGGVARIQALR